MQTRQHKTAIPTSTHSRIACSPCRDASSHSSQRKLLKLPTNMDRHVQALAGEDVPMPRTECIPLAACPAPTRRRRVHARAWLGGCRHGPTHLPSARQHGGALARHTSGSTHVCPPCCCAEARWVGIRFVSVCERAGKSWLRGRPRPLRRVLSSPPCFRERPSPGPCAQVCTRRPRRRLHESCDAGVCAWTAVRVTAPLPPRTLGN